MTELQLARLYGRAVINRWEIPNEKKGEVMASLIDIATNGTEESSRIAAARAIIAAESQNQKDEHAKIDEFKERVLAIAQRCGIDVDLLRISETTQDGSGD